MPSHAPARRRSTAPLHPRRVSGPARPRAVPAVALPAGRTRGRTGAFERLRGLPDKRVVDRLLRGRLCIWVIGVMLGGIVAMQVSLLRLNAGISRGVATATALELQNSDYEASIAALKSSDRVQAWATSHGMVDPPAGDARFLGARPATDAARAVKRMKPPSDTALEVMANGGRLPGVAATGAATSVATTTTTTTPPATATTTTTTIPPATAAATVTPAPTPVPTPVATATPVPTAPGTGAAMAPQG
jgi:hypothetical protein